MEDTELSDRIEVLAIRGIPHVREGDDVGSLIVDAGAAIWS
jgi:F420-0:gamma-glutamyl ligase